MKKWIALVLLLLVGAEAFAQGSAPSPPQIWRRKGTSDTSYIVTNTGDSIFLRRSGSNILLDLRGTHTDLLINDSVTLAYLGVTANATVVNELIVGDGATGTLTINNALAQQSVYSFTGDGMSLVNGYLTATLGQTIEGSEVTNQTLTKSDIDTTASYPFGNAYHVTSASTDSAYKTKYYIDHNLFGYSVTGTPAASQTPIYDAGLNSWTFGAGGGGSGDNARIDQTLDNSDYVVGSTTYTGGFWDVSTYTMRGDTGLNIVKSGAHPGDTAIFRPDWARIQRNDGTQSIRTFRTTSGDTLLVMQDSASFTKMTTSNNSGWKFEAPVHIDNNLVFDNTSRTITGPLAIQGQDDALPLYIGDSSSLNLQTSYTNKPVVIGSSSNWTIRADTIRASNGQILGIKYASVDTLYAHRELMRAGQFGILTSTDTALLYTRDSTNDTTTVRAVGKLKFTADAGLTEMDSVALHGRLRMYDGTNKSRIDSASQVLADTIKTLPGGYLRLQGATSGQTSIRGNASAITSYTLTLPAAQGTSSQTLVNDGSGNLSWSSAGGGGNGSADFDSTTSLDSNILKGASGTILLDVHKSATPNVVIGKGAGMTSLIIGGNASGVASIDTAALIYNNLYFGNALNKQSKIDSTFVYEQLKKLRYYFKASDLYWSPEKANAADKRFLSWNMCDTSATWPNNTVTSILFDLVDSTGSSIRPLNLTWFATERDSLFSTVLNFKTDSGAFYGLADTSRICIGGVALYKNGSKIDTLTVNKASATATTDSLNWTDVAIAAGDVMTIQLWLNTKDPGSGTRDKRLRVNWAYLNMRRY